MRLENIYKRIVKGESPWREFKEYLENIDYANVFMGLSKFLKKTNWSKNTTKKYLRLALNGKISSWQLIVYLKKKIMTFR